ncbi:hypothetical protein L3X38_043760 [Prunus dulcis]|uniref:Gag-pol polyprotein n=1 Tax=Prunus dulcis TaxID=3755 RepID=A0AAD4UYP9_PRUDU|nr:hypothetical protein L3X38_043760 [Prunus dulcis]
MKSFLWSLDERVWSTVVHGFPKPTKKIGKGDEETTILKAREEWTTAEVTHSTNNQKGLNALFTAVSSDQFEYISGCDTSKEACDILQVTHEGTDTVKGAKLQMHTLQFETLMMDENETFSEFYAKLCVIVNACSSLGEKIPEDRVAKKILRSLPQRFQPKITAIEEIRDLNTLKVQELIGSIQTYEMKHLAPKKSENVAFKVVNEEDDGHSNEDCSDEELTILTRRFMNFLKNQDPRSRDSKGINSKNKFVNYTDGYGHISSECANTLKKQKDSKNKAMHITWSDSIFTNVPADENKHQSLRDLGKLVFGAKVVQKPRVHFSLEEMVSLTGVHKQLPHSFSSWAITQYMQSRFSRPITDAASSKQDQKLDAYETVAH